MLHSDLAPKWKCHVRSFDPLDLFNISGNFNEFLREVYMEIHIYAYCILKIPHMHACILYYISIYDIATL